MSEKATHMLMGAALFAAGCFALRVFLDTQLEYTYARREGDGTKVPFTLSMLPAEWFAT